MARWLELKRKVGVVALACSSVALSVKLAASVRLAAASGKQCDLNVPLKSCRPMSAKMESTKSVKMLTSRSRLTASISASTIVRKPAL